MRKRNKAGREETVRGFYALDIITGAQNLATLSPQDLFNRERPEDIRAMLKLARERHKENWFIEQITLLKQAFYNYALEIRAARKGGQKRLESWLAEAGNREALLRYIGSVWSEWLLMDSVISFWRKEAQITPYLLLAETVKYSDAMGIEKLKVSFGYKPEQLKEAGLSPEMVKRYSGPEVTLDEKFDEYFKVLTRGLRGSGLGVPRLYRVFRTLSQCESMEVGESMLAYAGRLVVRNHKIGFEVKSGSNAMRQSEYLWKKERAKAIQKFFNGRQGFAETTSQFDHIIEHIWTDPKLYDASKWNSIVDRLMWWAGPLGFMMVAKSVSPFLLGMLKAEVLDDRERVGAHMESVINAGFNIGTEVKLSWGNRCFHDPRLAWEMAKGLMVQGPLSLTSALELADFDPEEEALRKKQEASASRDDELLPRFDPNHGNSPGDEKSRLKNERAGRKAGTKDGEAS